MSERLLSEPEPHGSSVRRLLVVGGSAGCLGVLTRISEWLPGGSGLAALVVVHRGQGTPTMLPAILRRHSVFRSAQPSDGDSLLPDYIYVAPSDRHLEVGHGVVTTNRGPRVNGQRPSIDILFESAARAYGPTVTGVVLSGNLNDGAAGLLAIRRAGGQAVVQDPEDADFPMMPRSAIERAGPVLVAPKDRLPEALGGVLSRPLPGTAPARRPSEESIGNGALGAADEAGTPVGVTCPECGGSLWLAEPDTNPTLRCRIGHRMTPDVLQDLHSDRLEKALWAGLRSLEEEVAVARFMEDTSRKRDDSGAAERHRRRREIAAGETEVLRQFLLQRSDD